MCIDIGRKCTFCDYERPTITWEKCQKYWALYREAIEQDDMDARPIPENCENKTNFFKPLRIGLCKNMPKCGSYQVYLRHQFLREQIAAREKEREEAERRKREEFASKYFIKQPVPARKEPVPFVEMIRDAKLRRQQELLASTKQKLQELKKKMGLTSESNPIQSDSDESEQPATPKKSEKLGYALQRGPARSNWDVSPEDEMSAPVTTPSFSMSYGMRPPPRRVVQESVSDGMGVVSDEFVTTSDTQFMTALNSPERGATPPTDLTDSDGLAYSSSANPAQQRVDQHHNFINQVLESEASTYESTDSTIPPEFLGIASSGSDSPLFPGFLGMGDLENNIHDEVDEDQDIRSQVENMDENEFGYDADVSDIGDYDHNTVNEWVHASTANQNTSTSLSDFFNSEGNTNPPEFIQMLARRIYNDAPSNSQTVLNSYPSEPIAAQTIVCPPPGFIGATSRPKCQGIPPNFRELFDTLATEQALASERILVRPPQGFADAIPRPKRKGTPLNFRGILNSLTTEEASASDQIIVRPPPGFGEITGRAKNKGTSPNFQDVLNTWSKEPENSTQGLVSVPPGFGDIADRPKHIGTPPNFQDVLNPWLTKPKTSIKTDRLHAFAELEKGDQSVADELSKLNNDIKKKPKTSYLWNPLRGLKKMFTMSLIVGKGNRQN